MKLCNYSKGFNIIRFLQCVSGKHLISTNTYNLPLQLFCLICLSLGIFLLLSLPDLELLDIIFFAIILAIAACFALITLLDLGNNCFRIPISPTKWVYITTAGACSFSICVGILVVKLTATEISVLEIILEVAYCLTTILFLFEVMYILKYCFLKIFEKLFVILIILVFYESNNV